MRAEEDDATGAMYLDLASEYGHGRQLIVGPRVDGQPQVEVVFHGGGRDFCQFILTPAESKELARMLRRVANNIERRTRSPFPTPKSGRSEA